MQNKIRKAAQRLLRAQKVVALTGAGISAESGIPTFRDPGGFWERFDPNIYANIQTFHNEPEKPWEMVKEFYRQVKVQPNPGHLALAELEKMGYLHSVITQNVDNLHQQAGSIAVIEFHGNLRRAVCLFCHRSYDMAEISMEALPPRCLCGGILKPDAVFFGELIPEKALALAHLEAETCDVMLVIGTSAIVHPAASMPEVAKRAGATIIEINPEATELTGHVSDELILGQAGEVLPDLVRMIKSLTGF